VVSPLSLREKVLANAHASGFPRFQATFLSGEEHAIAGAPARFPQSPYFKEQGAAAPDIAYTTTIIWECKWKNSAFCVLFSDPIFWQ